RIVVGNLRGHVERVARRTEEALYALIGPADAAEIDRVVVPVVRILGREPQGLTKFPVGLLLFPHPCEKQGARAVHIGIVGVLLERTVELGLRDGEIAAPQISDSKLRVVDSGVLALLHLLLTRAAGEDPCEQGGGGNEAHGSRRFCARPILGLAPAGPAAAVQNRSRRFCHACTASPNVRLPSRTVVRSITRPASWPQAASMSSPRVRCTASGAERRISSSRKRCTASGAER